MKTASYYRNIRSEMLEYIPSTAKKVLDVGCGEGIFAASVREKTGAEVWGIEMVQQAARIAQSKLDKAFCGKFEEVFDSLPTNYFDVVIFNDVLEHLVDPEITLELVKKILNPNGIIVASIPNVRFFENAKEMLLQKDWHYRKEGGGILDSTHLRFFTQKSIKRMFQTCGYELLSIKGVNSIHGSIQWFLFNILTLGWQSDMRHLQFACVAKVNKK